MPVIAQVSDDFSDDDLSDNPSWNGDLTDFIVEEDRLKSNGTTEKSHIFLATEVYAPEVSEWQLQIDLQFAPSGSNQLRFFLLSDSSDLSKTTNGIFIEIGQTGDDQFHIKEIKEGATTTILSSTKIFSGSVRTTLKVLFKNNEWQLFLKDELDFILDSKVSGVYPGLNNTYTGLYCKYTSTRKDKFYFDNFYTGPLVLDTAAPELINLEVIDEKSLQLEFNESIGSVNEQTIFLNDLYSPAIEMDRNILRQTFPVSFREGENSLFISGIEDVAGNLMPDTTIRFEYFTISMPSIGDILINEFMADPSPMVELPESEYVELWNPTEKHFDLSQLTLNGREISYEKKILKAGSYIILCPENHKQDFIPYGQVVELQSWDILKNSEDVIQLISKADNQIIDEVSYTSDWFNDTNKKNGGYSLERINKIFPCEKKYNWMYAVHTEGGTPGAENSVTDIINDTAAPQVDYVLAKDAFSVEVVFSEPLNPFSVQTSDFTSTDISFIRISDYENSTQVLLETGQPIEKNRLYSLKIKKVADCYGNELSEEKESLVLPDSLVARDIILTELLFDPYPTGVDFIEIYNNSDKMLNLQDIFISNDTSKIYTVSEKPKIIFPGDYLSITLDITKVASDYPKHGNLHQVRSMPSMPNVEGAVYLLDKNKNKIDFAHYHEDQHLQLLSSTEGVSLEKILLKEFTINPDNWQSAASTAGFATPGLVNSQYLSDIIGDKVLTLSNSYFTPNHDGEEDMLVINYNLDQSGMIGTIKIYDPFGDEVAELANNFTLGTDGKFFWDGINHKGLLAPTGHYIVVAEIYSVQGDLIKVKEKIALIH